MRQAGVHIGALQTVAKLLEPSAYFKIYERNNRHGRLNACHKVKLFSMARNNGRYGSVITVAA
jgi:hypothetical protein